MIQDDNSHLCVSLTGGLSFYCFLSPIKVRVLSLAAERRGGCEMRYTESVFTALGTVNTISVRLEKEIEKNARATVRVVKEYVLDADNRLSVFKHDSMISRINENAGICPVPVDDDTWRLLEMSLDCSKRTYGAFDILLGSATDYWRKSRDGKASGYPAFTSGRGKLVLAEEDRLAYLTKAGESIDLGGIAKGYIADKALGILRSYGIQNALLNFGGTVAVMGKQQKVGIRNPFTPICSGSSDVPVAYITCKDEIIVTSGVYEQSYTMDGRSYSHIIDPRTSKPVDSEIISVTLVGKNGTELDAFATAYIILGLEKSVELCSYNGIEAIMILRDGSIYATEGLRSRLRLCSPVSEAV